MVLDEDEFAKTLIPELFKHNNYASFVRQLNMYGFHKRVGLSDNSMKASERKNKSPSEYYNPYFKRGRPNLLWLINKPKGGKAGSKPSKAVKNENDGREIENDEDVEDVEETFGPTYNNKSIQNGRAVSVVPESGSGSLQRMAGVQREILEIQKQQGLINQNISRLRTDHNQLAANLYQQATAFQALHDRHEVSINAILAFLQTIYARSLDGENPGGNIAQMFANVFPQNQQQQSQGSVVDMGDVANLPQQPGSASPIRRQQRLLMAPPGGRANTVSPSGESTPQPQYQGASTPQSGAIEELFDSPSGDNNNSGKGDIDMPQQDMLSLIQNTNAANSSNGNTPADFPDMLPSYENGNSTLTPQQRNNMLSMLANQTTDGGAHNPLSPTAPQLPLEDYRATEAQMNNLLALQNDTGRRLNQLTTAVTPPPLSPSAILNGDTSFFANSDPSMDLDQYLDPTAFYNGSNDYYNDDVPLGDSHFDLGMDGTTDSKIETIETPSPPEIEVVDEPQQRSGSQHIPVKRRRKN